MYPTDLTPAQTQNDDTQYAIEFPDTGADRADYFDRVAAIVAELDDTTEAAALRKLYGWAHFPATDQAYRDRWNHDDAAALVSEVAETNLHTYRGSWTDFDGREPVDVRAVSESAAFNKLDAQYPGACCAAYGFGLERIAGDKRTG